MINALLRDSHEMNKIRLALGACCKEIQVSEYTDINVVTMRYRALSWSHDTWALIALIVALLSAILVLGLLWKYMGLCSVLVLLIRITRAPRAQVKIIFLQMLVMC